MSIKKGFSLTEVMVAIAISAMIAVPLYYIYCDFLYRSNLATARDHIKKESNKVLNILENDLSQAMANSFTQNGNEFSIKVHLKDEEKHGMKDLFGKAKLDTPTLKYVYNKPKLHRYFDGKCWLVSKVVDSLDIIEPSEAEKEQTPGKLTVRLVMKSDLVGIKTIDQPTYEQNKVVIIREEAASLNDPNWFGVGKLYDSFSTSNNLLASLKKDSAQLFKDNNEDSDDDLKSLTKLQLKQHLKELNDNLAEIMKNLVELQKEIDEMDRRAFYESKYFGFLRSVSPYVDYIKKTLRSFRNSQQMNEVAYQQFVKKILINNTNFTHLDTIQGLWDGKRDLLKAGEEIMVQISKVKKQLNEVGG